MHALLSEFFRSDFNLCGIHGFMVAFPRMPYNAICVAFVFAPQIETIQVRGMACTVPPATLVKLRTALCRFIVVVLIFGCKFFVVMGTFQRITCKIDFNGLIDSRIHSF
ncbi:hypothetical protein CDAR_588401 [Caerostris darwini]|uniref:Uncharacterized protein n=1 Tax=Caerostris darwini TaxID=1538125 RepID=A0AAV4SAR5_9ARAC|nr:hypothetical protein CDAR_588401 [Caerostris darwini]